MWTWFDALALLLTLRFVCLLNNALFFQHPFPCTASMSSCFMSTAGERTINGDTTQTAIVIIDNTALTSKLNHLHLQIHLWAFHILYSVIPNCQLRCLLKVCGKMQDGGTNWNVIDNRYVSVNRCKGISLLSSQNQRGGEKRIREQREKGYVTVTSAPRHD